MVAVNIYFILDSGIIFALQGSNEIEPGPNSLYLSYIVTNGC
jgi:hypothetical protein